MRTSTDEGWALVSVLWIVAMLAMMAAATQYLLLTFAKGERRVYDQARAEAILDAAVNRAVLGIGDLRPDKRWRTDGSNTSIAFDGIRVDVKIQDQLGLIDLNAADGSMITQLLQSVGETRSDAVHLTDRILDWRSATNLKSLDGGSDADYTTAGRAYHPRHGPFQSVSELQLVLGITSKLYARLEPALTVYSNHPAFDPNVAPKAVLKALYLDSPDQVEAVLGARSELSAGSADALSSLQAAAGRAYGITASLSIGDRRYMRSAVVELTGDDKRPYLTLFWQ